MKSHVQKNSASTWLGGFLKTISYTLNFSILRNSRVKAGREMWGFFFQSSPVGIEVSSWTLPVNIPFIFQRGQAQCSWALVMHDLWTNPPPNSSGRPSSQVSAQQPLPCCSPQHSLFLSANVTYFSSVSFLFLKMEEWMLIHMWTMNCENYYMHQQGFHPIPEMICFYLVNLQLLLWLTLLIKLFYWQLTITGNFFFKKSNQKIYMLITEILGNMEKYTSVCLHYHQVLNTSCYFVVFASSVFLHFAYAFRCI